MKKRCHICNRECTNQRSLSIHCNSAHSMTLIDYLVKYENFTYPNCIICGKPAKYKSGRCFRKTCGDIYCKKQVAHKRRFSVKTKEKMRESRLKWMKNNADRTAWRLKSTSYIESVFEKAIISRELYTTFEIVREKSVFPYYIDFAFMNVKVAVELDGTQHKQTDRIAHDIKRDSYLMSNGWRVFRATSSQIMYNVSAVIDELLEFIGNDYAQSSTSKIETGHEKRIKKKLRETITKLLMGEFFIIYKKKRILSSNINFMKQGWVNEVSKILEITPQKVGQWMRKNMSEFYEANCKKRKKVRE